MLLDTNELRVLACFGVSSVDGRSLSHRRPGAISRKQARELHRYSTLMHTKRPVCRIGGGPSLCQFTHGETLSSQHGDYDATLERRVGPLRGSFIAAGGRAERVGLCGAR